MNLAAFDPGLFGPVLAAGLLVTATHVPLGQQVLRRGIIFIDLAIAQFAGLGIIVAYALGWAADGIGAQIAAAGAALFGALVLNATDRRWPQIQEAIIGVAFVLAATAAILLLSRDPHGGERLKDLLVGQILWVTWQDLQPVAMLYAGVLTLWFGWGRRLGQAGFYVLFALCVTASVQLVGVYLVFASLIIPALATRARAGARQLTQGYLIGLLGYACGFVASTLLDLPTSALIVWCLALLALLVAWLGD